MANCFYKVPYSTCILEIFFGAKDSTVRRLLREDDTLKR